MILKQLLENFPNSENGIGVSVVHPGDPRYMDFQVFAWPDPENTISNQCRYLDQKLSANGYDDTEAYQEFYDMLQDQSEPTELKGTECYGPFNNISGLIK